MHITTEEAGELERIANRHGCEVDGRYQGAGMYGGHCVAVVCDDEAQLRAVLGEFFASGSAEVDELVDERAVWAASGARRTAYLPGLVVDQGV